MVPMKVLAEAIGLVLGSPLHPTHAISGGGGWTPAQWFLASEQGIWLDPSDLTAEKQAFRKNLTMYTESLGEAATYTPNVTYQQNARLAPNGQMAMDKIIATAVNGPHGYGPFSYTAMPGAIYTMSVYVAYGGIQYVSIKPDNNWYPVAVFDLVNGVVVSQSPSATNVSIEALPDDIYRMAVSGIPDAGADRYGFLVLQDGPAYANWTGNGIDGVYAWGFQIEKGNVATAYQPIQSTYEALFLSQYPNHTMFQDSTSTVPVTAVEQPVGLLLDKSGRGNHASQGVVAAARPVLSARKNKLLATATMATQSVTLTASAHTLSFKGTGTVTLTGASTAGPLVGTGVSNRVSLTFTPTDGSVTFTVSGSVTDAQLEYGSAAGTYQRVSTATSYDEVGFPFYELYDGVDDHVTHPAGGASTAFAIVMGVRPSTVSVAQTLWSDRTGNTGLKLEITAAGNIQISGGNGSAIVTATGAAMAAHTDYVVTAKYDGANLSVQLGNGAETVAACALVAGTSTATIGKDNGAASAPFNGRIYDTIHVKDSLPSDLTPAKEYIAGMMQVTL